MKLRVIMLLFLGFALVAGAHAQETVHSDLPLFSGRNEPLWPRGFAEKDEWGCTSRVAFGDWKFVELADEGAEPNSRWLRLQNYGVFHCAAIEQWADEREELGQRGFKHSWFVELGRARRGDSELELWALQSGSRPGSNYLLLARKPEPGLIKSFEVLAVDCPREHQRNGEGPDIWRADYCAINSARDLKSFAKKMAGRPSAGKLTFVDKAPETAKAND